MKRPARGDNRAGQAIWAQGWMGARARYGLSGRDVALPQPVSHRGTGNVQTHPKFFGRRGDEHDRPRVIAPAPPDDNLHAGRSGDGYGFRDDPLLA
jgi:hypothetical protein